MKRVHSTIEVYQPNFQKVFESIAENFMYLVQESMVDSGFSVDEIVPYQSSFIFLMNSTLIVLLAKLLLLRQNIGQDLTKEEKLLKVNLTAETDLSKVIEGKMAIAIETVTEKFSESLRSLMIQSDFQNEQCEDEHEYYVFLFARSTTLLSEMFFRYKSIYLKVSRSNGGHISKDLTNADTSNENSTSATSTHISLGENFVQECLKAKEVKLLAKTDKHSILLLSTSFKYVVVKILNSSSSYEHEVLNLDNELHFSSKLKDICVRQVLKRINYNGKESLLLEYVNGISVQNISYVAEDADLISFLNLARGMVQGVRTMHKQGVMHLNLSSSHFIVDLETKVVKLIGTGSAAYLRSKIEPYAANDLRDRDLYFTSPELTGLSNRKVDYRSDFYSLGIIFYVLLTGMFPFSNESSLKLMFMHIIDYPEAVHDLNPRIPIRISEMISKLMSKYAEDRYNSAEGIIYDIDSIISEFEHDHLLQNVVLGEHDRKEILLISEKLYGRKEEIERLNSALKRANQGAFELVFVAGVSGCGKSSLVFELYMPTIQAGGFFLHGKYNIHRNEPYSALIEAFQRFIYELLLLDQKLIQKYRRTIQEALGEQGKLITNLVHNLSLLIGDQPEVCELSGRKAKQRLNFVLLKFLKAICSVGKTIVLLLDDLQRVDPESISLLSALVADNSIRNFFLIGTYRVDEVDDQHLVSNLIMLTTRSNISKTTIHLENLDKESLNDLIADTLSVTPYESFSLTAFVYKLAKGNCFLVQEILYSLYDRNLVTYSSETGKWSWERLLENETKLEQDAFELIRKKILSFPQETQQVLKVASCVGNSFRLSFLSSIIENKQAVKDALASGTIVASKGVNPICRFVHDKVMEAAYSLLPPNPREVFFYIGIKLWKSLPEKYLNENIFVIVNLLRNTADFLTSDTERFEIVQLFLCAGRRALKSTSFEKSLTILNNGIEYLGPNSWEKNYQLSLNIYDLTCTAAYCCGNEERLVELKNIISSNVILSLDLTHSLVTQLRLWNEKHNHATVIREGQMMLKHLGENLDSNGCGFPTLVKTMKELLSNKSDEEILSMKIIDEKDVEAKLYVYHELLHACYNTNPQLFALVGMRMLQITCAHGISKTTLIGFLVFASALYKMEDKSGYRYGILALQLLERLQAKDSLPFIFIAFYAHVSPFFSAWRNSLDPYLVSVRVSQEIGDNLTLNTSVSWYLHFSFASGTPLSAIMETIENYKGAQSATITLARRTILILNDETNTSEFSVKESLLQWRKEFQKHIHFSGVLLFFIQIAYLHYDYVTSYKDLETYSRIKHFLPNYQDIVIPFYRGLTISGLIKSGNSLDLDTNEIEKCIILLRNFAEDSCENCLNKILLLEAELASLSDCRSKAIQNYEESIDLATKYGFLQEEAIACEHLGSYYITLNMKEKALKWLKKAFDSYREWGSISNMKMIVKKYPYFLDLKSSSTNSLPEKVIDFSELSISDISDVTNPSIFVTHKRLRQT